MAKLKKFRPMIEKLCPPIFLDFLFKLMRVIFEIRDMNLIKKNKKYKNIHAGERCFILGNAPALDNFDLKKLAGEKVISISAGYHHPDYSIFKPQFHCLPQITYSKEDGGMNEERAKFYLNEMFEKTDGATLFFHKDIKKVNYSRDYLNRDVCWIGTSRAAKSYRCIDLTKHIATVNSAPQLAIAAALYMGFKEIYLLGIEYNTLCNLKYEYFFTRDKLPYKDPHVTDTNDLKESRLDHLRSYVCLFEGFDRLRHQASAHGSEIYNCSNTSFLDVYPFCDFDQLFR